MNRPTVSGPHAHGGTSIRRTMLWVMLALTPATAMGLYQFGWPAIYLFGITIAACVLAELVCLKIAGKPVLSTLGDGSAILTGWLLAMTLPPWAPWWIAVIGAVVAIVIAKQIFGGLGQNLFNPAMVARVALLISFPVEMTRFVQPQPLAGSDAPGPLESMSITFGDSPRIDAVTAATQLDRMKTEVGAGTPLEQVLNSGDDLMSLAMGSVPGSLGETSAALLLAGGVLLLAARVITWHIPLAMLGTLAALAALFHGIDPAAYPPMSYHLLSGATLLGAFFIATDLVTSPVSVRGQLLFGFGCGVLVYVIRSWAGYPEGVAFAVLLMNASTPLIDHWLKPRVYGRDRRGEPIGPADPEDAS